MQNEIRFIKWQHHAEAPEKAPIFPDGCRDLLIIRKTDGPADILLTELDFRPRIADLRPGVRITGYRLRPGLDMPPKALEAVAADTSRAQAIVEEECGRHTGLDDAIAALAAPCATAGSSARDLGVSIRTMQRLFLKKRLPPPDFWRLLARARQAAALLATSAPLAEIAFKCGFSDQAHMTRELVRWFGLSPGHLRRNTAVIDLLRQPALGNWTGEQISTR
ncbi:helix-turn-helix domain-containing protein [Pannonibacter phragmitetus]|uniref:helix-turn-helix domain-containing protein n=1 Tax=Pannonibacter phragmitetus TaxID=121719 RepID=UPI003D2F0D45